MASQAINNESKNNNNVDAIKTSSLLDKMLMQQDLKMKNNFEFENLTQLLAEMNTDKRGSE